MKTQDSSGRDWIVAALVFVGTAAIFLASPRQSFSDSRYSMLLSESLLHHQTFAIDEHFSIEKTDVEDSEESAFVPRQFDRHNGHLYHAYPPGGPILSIPLVAVLNAFGVSSAHEDGAYDDAGEAQVQAIVAGLVMAAFVVIVYCTARLLLPWWPSAIVALGSGLGTQIWSTASRAVWTHTWAVFLLGVVIWILLRSAVRSRPPSPGWLATIMSWMYFTRPSGSIVVVGVVIYVALNHRAQLIRLLGVGFLWLVAFVGYSWTLLGRPLPNYYFAAQAMNSDSFWGAALGLLVSPSRGLFVYVPVVAFVLYLVFRYRGRVAFPGLVWLALGCSVLHVAAVASHFNWWGGHCYGARYTTCLVPWFALLVILGLAARQDLMRSDPQAGPGRLEVALGVILLLVSVLMNALGAVTNTGKDWNGTPMVIDTHRERLWDWKHAQFLASFAWPLPWDYLPLSRGQRLETAKAGDVVYFWKGWSDPRGGARWTIGRSATVNFRWTGAPSTLLRMQLQPYVTLEKRDSQRIQVLLNDQPIGDVLLELPGPIVVSLPLAPGLLGERNILRFKIPKGKRWMIRKDGERVDSLGVTLTWLVFE